MAKLLKLLLIALLSICATMFTSCGDEDGPSLPSSVTSEKQEKAIACFDSNRGSLPSYATVLYEDSEYQYRVAARSPQYELIILPFYKQDNEWVAAYDYNSSKDVGKQLIPEKRDGNWLCSLVKYPKPISESYLENMTDKLNFQSNSILSIAPFNYRGCYYGYLTVEGDKKVNIKIYCALLQINHTQGSGTFGYITSARLEYQFY